METESSFPAQFIEYYKLYKGKIRKEDEIKPELPFVTKAIFFDFDGTLTKVIDNETTWDKIWKKLGYDVNLCSKFHQQFSRREISHKCWCEITLDHFKRKGMKEAHLLEVAKSIELVDGVEKTLKKLSNAGIKFYIISGSIRGIINEVLGELRDYFVEIKSNNLIFHSNGMLKNIIGTKYDFEGKARFIRETIREDELSPLEILFIGNSCNDIYASRSGVRTLCVNPHFTDGGDIRHWTYCIKKMDDLEMILEYVKFENN